MAMLVTADHQGPLGAPPLDAAPPVALDGLRSVPTSHASSDQLRRLHLAVMSMGSDLDLGIVLHRIVEAAIELVDASHGAIDVPGSDRTPIRRFIAEGLDARSTAMIGSLGSPRGVVALPVATTYLCVPVIVDGAPYGSLFLTDKRSGGDFTDIDDELAVALAAAAGMAIEKARLHTRLRRTDVVEDRDRIARDLHDTVVQHLFATGFTLQRALRVPGTDPEVTERIEQAIDGIEHVIDDIRATVLALHIAVGAEGGVRRKLLHLGDELTSALGFRPSFSFEGPVDTAISDDVASHLLAAVGEALANVARHARTSTASVLLRVEGSSLCALVDDDGVGPGTPRIGGHGLANLAHRAAALGGTCSLEARPGGGSRLRWQIVL
jgi:signal transduction histidine kinase